MATVSVNKAKIARRVVEVLDYFDEDHPEASVMDIVRRYERPQSSTSELLSSLVDLGILCKDRDRRCYRPTPRAAMLGVTTQAPVVREGRLNCLLDRLRSQTGLTAAMFDIVGVNCQVYGLRTAWSESERGLSDQLHSGKTESLTGSVVGHLLLSTLSRPRREGIIRRLNAEGTGPQVCFAELVAALDQHERKGHATGALGFGTDVHVCARLLPSHAIEGSIAIGLVYSPTANVDPEALTELLRQGIDQLVDDNPVQPSRIGVAA